MMSSARSVSECTTCAGIVVVTARLRAIKEQIAGAFAPSLQARWGGNGALQERQVPG
jgi:hypothetical protein